MSVDYQALKSQLVNILLDEEVAANQELYDMCLAAKQDLDKNEPENLVFTRLSKSLSWYLMSHRYHLPKAVTQLAQDIQKVEQAYRGDAATALILGGLFGAIH